MAVFQVRIIIIAIAVILWIAAEIMNIRRKRK